MRLTEDVMINRRYKKVEFLDVDARNMWSELKREVSFRGVAPNPSTLDKISCAVVIENITSKQFFVMLDRISNENGQVFVAVNGYLDNDWWFEASSPNWIESMKRTP
jgi:hypothetical protein